MKICALTSKSMYKKVIVATNVTSSQTETAGYVTFAKKEMNTLVIISKLTFLFLKRLNEIVLDQTKLSFTL